jgi:anti-sigma regulatory factor (Ser/Thr protein kinase)
MSREGATGRPFAGLRESVASAGDASQIDLPATPISCRLAREFVASLMGGAEDPRVALVVTELVANAVVHGHAEPHLRVGWDGQILEVEVEDDGPGRPVLRQPDLLTSSGRGLALVDRIADTWGVANRPDSKADQRKAVWARIRMEEAGGLD